MKYTFEHLQNVLAQCHVSEAEILRARQQSEEMVKNKWTSSWWATIYIARPGRPDVELLMSKGTKDGIPSKALVTCGNRSVTVNGVERIMKILPRVIDNMVELEILMKEVTY